MVRVLVVDDDPVIRRLLELNLELDGHEVSCQPDGRAGLDAIVADPPDVVLLDVMMPHLDGFQVCAAVRAHDDPRVAATPIIILSAKAQQADLDAGSHAGADSYVTKPFDPLELVAEVERLARPATG